MVYHGDVHVGTIAERRPSVGVIRMARYPPISTAGWLGVPGIPGVDQERALRPDRDKARTGRHTLRQINRTPHAATNKE